MKTNNTKKNSATKKLIPAVSMLTVSAMMLSTATYAWFTMNKEVSVTGMKLNATAENGLVISDYTQDNWATSWTVTMADAAVLSPTSTPAVTAPTWVRAESDLVDDAKANQATAAYTALSLTYSDAPTTGEGIGSASRSVTVGTGSEAVTSNITTNYTLLRKFYIKGSGDSAWAQNLVIDEVTAEAATGGTLTALDNSLRVLVVVGTDAYIYAPVQDVGSGTTTMSYTWKGTTATTARIPTYDGVCSSITSIPAANGTPIEVDMYMYFEGEDANCKSSNVSGITLSDIIVSAKFKTQDVPTP